MAGVHSLAPCRCAPGRGVYLERLYALGQLPPRDALCAVEKDKDHQHFYRGDGADPGHGASDRQHLCADEVHLPQRRVFLRKALWRTASEQRKLCRHCAPPRFRAAEARSRSQAEEEKEKQGQKDRSLVDSRRRTRRYNCGAHCRLLHRLY